MLLQGGGRDQGGPVTHVLSSLLGNAHNSPDTAAEAAGPAREEGAGPELFHSLDQWVDLELEASGLENRWMKASMAATKKQDAGCDPAHCPASEWQGPRGVTRGQESGSQMKRHRSRKRPPPGCLPSHRRGACPSEVCVQLGECGPQPR